MECSSTGEVFMEAESSYIVRGAGSPGMRVCSPHRRSLGEGQIRCVRRYSEFLYFAERASQYIYLSINQLDALNFIMSLFHACTCFEHMCSSLLTVHLNVFILISTTLMH